MNLKPYLRQTVSWEATTGVNDWDDRTYAAPVTLKARVSIKEKLTETKNDIQRPSRTVVMVGPQPEVKILDKIDSKTVEAREDIRGIKGELLGWKLYLETPQGF